MRWSGNCRTASQPDICTFGDYWLPSFSPPSPRRRPRGEDDRLLAATCTRPRATTAVEAAPKAFGAAMGLGFAGDTPAATEWWSGTTQTHAANQSTPPMPAQPKNAEQTARDRCRLRNDRPIYLDIIDDGLDIVAI